MATRLAIVAGLVMFLHASSIAVDGEEHRSTRYFGFFYGQSQLIFGSQDLRSGGGAYFGSGHPQERLRLGKYKGEFVTEGYLDLTTSKGVLGDPNNTTGSVGLLGFARYRERALYIDVGWGLQWVNRSTADLPSKVNSTPVFDAGLIFETAMAEWYLGARFMHISNGNTMSSNRGQNLLFFTIGISY